MCTELLRKEFYHNFFHTKVGVKCLTQKGLCSIIMTSLLLLLLSHFSRVQLCVTSETAAHQAPPSLEFSRQEYCSGLPFPSPMHESEKWKWSLSVMSAPSDPMDCSPPGSSIHGILQARILEWVAIAFSELITKLKQNQWFFTTEKYYLDILHADKYFRF